MIATMGPSVRVLTVEQAESAGWNEMLAAHPMGSVFQHTAFIRMIAATFGHVRPYVLSLWDVEERCIGGLAICLVKSWLTGRRLVSIPFAFYADPVVRSSEQFGVLFGAVLELAKREEASYVEVKCRNSVDILAETGLMKPVYYYRTYYLDLTGGLDAVWEQFHRSCVKQKISRAQKSGIQVRTAASGADVAAFHDLLSRNRRQLGLPPQKPEYFQNIWRELVPCRLARFYVAFVDARLVGGLCTFAFRDTLFLGYIAMDDSLRGSGVGQLLAWTAIQEASRQGMAIVDIGKTSPYADGLIQYKKHLGGIEASAPSFYYPQAMGVASHEDERQLVHRVMRLCWRIAPLGVSRAASRFFYRHTG